MFESLGHLIARRKKSVLSIFILATIVAGAVGSQVFNRFDSGGYSDPNSDSSKVWEYLDDTFKVKDPAIVLVVDAKNTSVDDPTVVATAQKLESEVRREASAESVLDCVAGFGDTETESSTGGVFCTVTLGEVNGRPVRVPSLGVTVTVMTSPLSP